MTLTRLQKLLAAAGVASRRGAEELITAGRVRVNGQVVDQLGSKADPTRDRIELDGRVIAGEQPVTVLINKPRGTICTVSDPEGRQTVVSLVRRVKARLYPVGRLDYNTSGALLLTNDGDLAHALTHPRHQVEKTYALKIRGKVGEPVLDRWRKGMELEDGMTRPAEVFRIETDENFTWLEVTIREGRNRQIRRMAEMTGLEVSKLKRLAFAGLTIEGLRIGQYRELSDREMSRLKRDYLNPAKRVERKRARGEADVEEPPQQQRRKRKPRKS